jgi:nicotinamidase-related amidase
MLAVLIYAYAIGERSSRRIERRLVEDLAFRVVAATQRPDHATIARLTDCQMVVLSNYGPNDPGYIGKLRAARDSAAAAGNLVIHVVTSFRTGHPEIAASNPTFAPVRDAGMLLENSGDAGMHPGLLPSGGDIVVTKRRISAFAGSDLEMILRSNHIDSLVLAGVATSGVILSTVRAAADLDYRILVVADGCYDPNPDLHKVLVRSIFPTQAEITDVDSWIDKAGRTHDLRSRPPRAHRFRVRALERSCRRP